MKIVRVVDGEPRVTLFWGLTFFMLVFSGVWVAITIPLFFWYKAQPFGSVPHVYVTVAVMGQLCASFIVGQIAIRWLIRRLETRR